LKWRNAPPVVGEHGEDEQDAQARGGDVTKSTETRSRT
jgi:hypothetical protein